MSMRPRRRIDPVRHATLLATVLVVVVGMTACS